MAAEKDTFKIVCGRPRLCPTIGTTRGISSQSMASRTSTFATLLTARVVWVVEAWKI